MRSFDGERLNFLVNHPEVRPSSGGDGKSWLDLAPYLEDHDNHFLDGDHGGLFFHWQAPDTYEVHIFVLPEGRGAWAYWLADMGLEYMMARGAMHLWARLFDRHAKIFTRRLFTYRGEKSFDLGGGPQTYSIFDWRRECPQQQS